jgi:hypothetical protein
MLRVPAVRPRRSPASSAQAVSPANSACYEPSVRMSMTHRFLRRRSRSSSSPLRKMALLPGAPKAQMLRRVYHARRQGENVCNPTTAPECLLIYACFDYKAKL